MTSQQKKIISIIVAIIIFFVGAVIIFRAKKIPPVSLEMWGVIDQPEAFQSLISKFEKMYPQITIHYSVKDSIGYQDELLRAFANNKAPDIFMLLGNWLPQYQDKIQPLDVKKEKELNAQTIIEIYPQVVLNELFQEQQRKLWGIPLYVDTLALFYNKDIFDHYNIALPPATWEEILNLVPQLRRLDEHRRLIRSAIALGTDNNVNWNTDILSALMMQYGSSIIDPVRKKVIFDQFQQWQGWKIIPGERALRFYSQFADDRSPYYTWNENQINSLLSFARGKSAMVIGYQRAITIFQKYNPQLNFGVAPLPQFRASVQPVYYASTMNLVVNNRTSRVKKQAAWLFLRFLAQKDSAEEYYSITHHPPARRDLIALHLNDPREGVFIKQILSSRNWYQFNASQIKTIFKQMIRNVVVKRMKPSDVVIKGAETINFLWYKSLHR